MKSSLLNVWMIVTRPDRICSTSSIVRSAKSGWRWTRPAVDTGVPDLMTATCSGDNASTDPDFQRSRDWSLHAPFFAADADAAESVNC